jgi:hypothetical protein
MIDIPMDIYKGRYFINGEEVVSKRTRYRPLHERRTYDGYKRVALYSHNGTVYTDWLVHRLVFMAHNPDVDISDKRIRHINGNVIDNRIENLEMID